MERPFVNLMIDQIKTGGEVVLDKVAMKELLEYVDEQQQGIDEAVRLLRLWRGSYVPNVIKAALKAIIKELDK